MWFLRPLLKWFFYVGIMNTGWFIMHAKNIWLDDTFRHPVIKMLDVGLSFTRALSSCASRRRKRSLQHCIHYKIKELSIYFLFYAYLILCTWLSWVLEVYMYLLYVYPLSFLCLVWGQVNWCNFSKYIIININGQTKNVGPNLCSFT